MALWHGNRHSCIRSGRADTSDGQDISKLEPAQVDAAAARQCDSALVFRGRYPRVALAAHLLGGRDDTAADHSPRQPPDSNVAGMVVRILGSAPAFVCQLHFGNDEPAASVVEYGTRNCAAASGYWWPVGLLLVYTGAFRREHILAWRHVGRESLYGDSPEHAACPHLSVVCGGSILYRGGRYLARIQNPKQERTFRLEPSS